jgi:hypothetical protein
MAGTKEARAMTALDGFVTACRRARGEPDWPEAVAREMRELFAAAGPALAEEARARIAASPEKGIAVFVNDPDLTVYAVGSPGGLRGAPHDHASVAVVGLIEGVEQYKVYRREAGRCVETGRVRVAAGEVAVMDEALVHAMWNEAHEGGVSLHVYGNGHFEVPERRQWDPHTLVEQPFDIVQQRAWNRELTRAARAAAATAA